MLSERKRETTVSSCIVGILWTVAQGDVKTVTAQGRPSHLRPWCISPLFQIPPIFETFSDSVENFQNVIFSRKISPFSSAKISDDLFLVINRKFRIPPIFPVSVHFPPVSRKFIFPPTLKNVPPVFEKFTCSYILYVHFVSLLLWPWCIYASPNARTGRPCNCDSCDGQNRNY